jgi:hypothetical protein
MTAQRVAGLSIAIFGVSAAAAAPAGSDELRAILAPCAGIAKAQDRLACYDKLSGRIPERSPAAVSPPAAAISPAAAAASPPPSPPATAADFGLSPAQKAPAAHEPIPSVTATITSMGLLASGRTSVALDNGQTWELEDAPDALLAVGQVITVRHASLGSFLLITPSKLSHRVRRIH